MDERSDTRNALRSRAVTVVIADPRAFDRLALEVLCSRSADVTVAAGVSTVAEAVAAVEKAANVVVLVGRQLLRSHGPESIASLRSAGAERVIIVGMGDNGDPRGEAMRVGADGVLRRDGDAESQLSVLHGESGTVPRWLDGPARPRPAA